MGKRLKNDQKYAILKNWLKTHPKVLNAQNKRVLHHFGGMLALKSGLVFEAFSHLHGPKTKIAFPDLKERSNQKVKENKLALK